MEKQMHLEARESDEMIQGVKKLENKSLHIIEKISTDDQSEHQEEEDIQMEEEVENQEAEEPPEKEEMPATSRRFGGPDDRTLKTIF